MAEAVAVKAQAPLDDLMLAMDVVDTLRHSEALAEREIAGGDRRARMIDRLREIYRGQGISVPDRILEEGVDALEKDRFVYKPKTGGFAFTLARLYVRRSAITRAVAIAAGVVLVAWGAWYFLVSQPRQRTAEATRIELTETLPARLAALQAEIAAEALDPSVAARTATTARDGTAAAAAGNGEAARAAAANLEATLAELKRVFDIRVVQREGTPSGVTRIPDVNQNTENYYLIVEAVGADGRAIPRTITSEEDRATREVTQWGVRVGQREFEAVRVDKQNDGIIQNAVLATKRRGSLEPEWTIPTSGGFILEW